MSGPQHKPESRCLPVSCGPGMPGPYASTMFYQAITAHAVSYTHLDVYKRQALRSGRPDLVILDVMLPDEDGYQILAKMCIRDRPQCSLVTKNSIPNRP